MEHSLKLSERLQRVADFLGKGTKFADIGSDHAYLPCYVCKRDSEASAIAGELNEGPFESARSTVLENGLQERIDVRHGDGLSVISPGEVKEVVIAGMGGTLISTILEAGKEKLAGVEKIIAQPNVDARSTRKWLVDHGYSIEDEAILKEKGHIYEIISAVKTDGKCTLTEKEALFGPILSKERPQPFIEKWQGELQNLERVLIQMEQAAEKDEKKMDRFRQEKDWMKEVLSNG
ncbi:class I SAM-dependent methyltransferase [Aciduricibacillus chroicocephali]|uniref:Class I SAM-dependent methyltransferase n=1 Tax=Aciduricibacillus chroicocephali TaxID=3054939 RepID=A0ABY9KSA4_9BACI|nr:class I SAM-dependent methyltransferase [Bacillaceae bacterium 44XB]